jgi:hypothetical protein
MSKGINNAKIYSGEFRTSIYRNGSGSAIPDAITIQSINMKQLPVAITDFCHVFVDSIIMFNIYPGGSTGSDATHHNFASYSGGMQKSVKLNYDPILPYPFSKNSSFSASPTKFLTYRQGNTRLDPDMSFQVRTTSGTDLSIWSAYYAVPDPALTFSSANINGETQSRVDFCNIWGVVGIGNTEITRADPNSINVNCAMFANAVNGNVSALINYSCVSRIVVAQPDLYGII